MVAVAIVCVSIQFNAVFATDDLTTSESQRRTGQPCVATTYGPFSGVFALDTGTTLSAVFGSARFYESRDPAWTFKELHGRFSTGSGTATVVENIPIAVFDGEAQPSRLVLFEKPARSPGLQGIDGLLGMPEMRTVRLRINLRDQDVGKLDTSWRPGKSAVMTPLEDRAGIDVRVPMNIASTEKMPVTVDTGCRPFLLLRRATLEFQQGLGNAVPANRIFVSTAIEIREIQTYILKSVTVCGFEFRDVQAHESNFNAIGMGCFSHFDMVLDFPQNEMWLTPHSDDWPKRVPPDASGLVLGYLDTNVLSLLRIQPDSAASKSELMLDDQILLFDGKEPKDLSMFEIHQRQTQAGTVLPLRIRRGDQEMDIALPLGYSFEYPPKWSNEKNVLDEFNEFLEKDNKPSESESAGK